MRVVVREMTPSRTGGPNRFFYDLETNQGEREDAGTGRSRAPKALSCDHDPDFTVGADGFDLVDAAP